jgi:4-amino-4-deoxy-L-arabinose transferase-like glycosyltransferase
MKQLQPYLPAIGVFCLALAVRIIYNVTVGHGYVPMYDSATYQQVGLNLIYSHCFCQTPGIPTARYAPLWPVVIASIYRFLSPRNIYVRLALSFVGAGTCVIVYLFAKDLFGKRVALVGGILAAIYPNLFIYDGWLYSEALYTFLFFGFCYTLYLVQRTSAWRWIIISGILAGLLSLTRANGIFIPVILLIWAIIILRAKGISWQTAVKSFVAISLITIAIVAPWTIRNYTISHTFTPVATEDGLVLIGAYNQLVLQNGPFQYIWIRPSLVDPSLEAKYHQCPICEVQQDNASKAVAYAWIKTHVNEMPQLLAMHVVKMFTPSTPEGDLPMNQFPTRLSSQAVMLMINIFSYPVFILAAFGLIVTWRKWRELLFCYLAILLTIAECIYIYGSSRFRAPIEPILILLVAGAVWWVTEKDPGTLRWLRSKKVQGDETLSFTTGNDTDPLVPANIHLAEHEEEGKR